MAISTNPKPHTLSGTPNAEMVEQIDEMFTRIFDLLNSSTAGVGDVVGPSVAVSGNVPLYSGVTGKLLSDSGYPSSTLVRDSFDTVSVSGNVPQFDGTDKKIKDSGIAIGSLLTSASLPVFKVKLVLTNAQIQSLSTVPVDIVAAPGAGIFIAPSMYVLKKDSAAGAYSANPSIRIRHNGIATDVVNGQTPNLNSADIRWAAGGSNSWGPITTDVSNKSLQISSTADVTGGNVANSMTIWLIYYLAQ